MITSAVVFFTLAIFSFFSSVVQSFTGIGDTICLHVLWRVACMIAPSYFTTTPLGTDPTLAVTVLIYARLLLILPLELLLTKNTGVFSTTFTMFMTAPNCVATVIGVLVFSPLPDTARSLGLGISCAVFFGIYVVVCAGRELLERMKVARMEKDSWTFIREADAVTDEVRLSRSRNMLSGSSFRLHGMLVEQSRAAAGAEVGETAAGMEERGSGDATDAAASHEAFLSTVTGAVFVAAEAKLPVVTERVVPPLTPTVLSPLRTLTYTRVRVNRSLDNEGKVRLMVCYSGAVASLVAGFTGALAGLVFPPYVIVDTLLDLPHYVSHVNFYAQAIPASVVRFVTAMGCGYFHFDQIPLLLDAVIFGYAGVFVSVGVGRILGPIGIRIVTASILLLGALSTMSISVGVLIFFTVLVIIISCCAVYWEHSHRHEAIEALRESEMEITSRVERSIAALRQRASAGLPSSAQQRPQRPRLAWSNLDNDDDAAPGGNRSDNQQLQQQRRSSIASAKGQDGLGGRAVDVTIEAPLEGGEGDIQTPRSLSSASLHTALDFAETRSAA